MVFLTFSSKSKRNLPVFSVWKELPGEPRLPLRTVARPRAPQQDWDGRAAGSERTLAAVSEMKCGIKQKRRHVVLACLLASDFLRTVCHCPSG